MPGKWGGVRRACPLDPPMVYFIAKPHALKFYPRKLKCSLRYLPPATKLGQGYVFTGICDSVNRGVVCLSAYWDTNPWSRHPRADTPWSRHPQEHTPQSRHPWEQTPPRSRHPLEQTPLPQEQTPPGSRHPQEQTPLSRHPPPGADTPSPREQTPPPGAEHAGRYGQRAGGTHPTGMQSCFISHHGNDSLLS